MNNKIILLLIGAIMLIGIGGWVYATQLPASAPAPIVITDTRATPTTSKVEAPKPASVKSSVQKVSWHTEPANPGITDSDDNRKYEQAVSIDVTFSDKSMKRYSIGKAYGCDTTNVPVAPELGRMKCYYALTGVDFVAYLRGGKLIVERHDESAMDGSIAKTVVLEI